MRTIRTKVYQFSELSKDAQQKAIDWGINNELNTDYEWHEFLTNDWVENLEELGFEDATVMFSGFSCQGDGACFTCKSIDFDKFLKGKYKGLDITADITHNYRYYFSTSTTVNLEGGEGITDELYKEIETAIETEREVVGNKIYRILEKEYDYLTSEDAIKETIISNEYEFTKEGNRF